MKLGFDNDKYLEMQSAHIRERISHFDNKLYLEFGGKLFDDYHASRVLPGFAAGQQTAHVKSNWPTRLRSLSSSVPETLKRIKYVEIWG